MDEEARLKELLADAISSKVQHHRHQEQQQVDALLSSQKYLTSNLRTLINSLDTVLQLSTPRFNTSQGDLVSSCANRAKALAHKLDNVAARLTRIQDHLQQEEVKYGLKQPAAAAAAAATVSSADTPSKESTPTPQQQQQQQQQEHVQEQVQQQQQEQEQELSQP